MFRTYDCWKSDDRFEDAELHSECRECFAEPQTVFEEMDGICERCLRLEERERMEAMES